MQSFESEALVNARPSTVWEVLTDMSNLTVCDSGITNLDGALRLGGTIWIRSARDDGRTLGTLPGAGP